LRAEDIVRAAERRGFQLKYDGFGPFFRVGATAVEDKTTRPISLGYITGFTVPFMRYVHLDEMRIFNAEIRKIKGEGKTAIGAYGAGLLLGSFALCRLRDGGIKSAELMAINDTGYQHARLVRYYERMGFEVVRVLGSGDVPVLTDLLDQMTWGGVGTLMRADIDTILGKWSHAFDPPSRNKPPS